MKGDVVSLPFPYVGGQLLAAFLSLPASVRWEVMVSRTVGGVGVSSVLPGRAEQGSGQQAPCCSVGRKRGDRRAARCSQGGYHCQQQLRK